VPCYQASDSRANTGNQYQQMQQQQQQQLEATRISIARCR